MAKFHDEQRDPEHAELVADICKKKNIDKIVTLVYPKHPDVARRIETKRGTSDVGYVYIIARDLADYSLPYLIIDARRKLNNFAAVTQRIKAYQLERYQRTRRTGLRGQDYPKVSGEVDQPSLKIHSQKVIVTRSKPDGTARTLAANEEIALIFHDKEIDVFHRCDEAA
jgi:hypothetical protein